MKKLIAALLSAALIFACSPVGAIALNDEDYDNQEDFTIDEDTDVLPPGQDYYFSAEWLDEPMDDEFFENYNVSVSVGAPEDSDLSTTQTKKYVDKAEFVKENDGYYYFHFRANTSYSYLEDVDVRIVVMAKFKTDSDTRSWYEMELEVGNSINSQEEFVDESPYDVDEDSPIVEFDEDLNNCRLDFSDGSYYQARLAKVLKFNLGYTFVENVSITTANPGAKMKFLNFYAKPKFAYESVLKVYARIRSTFTR
jgi:hypothetical protein